MSRLGPCIFRSGSFDRTSRHTHALARSCPTRRLPAFLGGVDRRSAILNISWPDPYGCHACLPIAPIAWVTFAVAERFHFKT
jgi:hypothetical protein